MDPHEADVSVAQLQEAVAEATINWPAVHHFRRHMHKAPNWVANQGVWEGLTIGEVKKDIQSADWVPNRASWRAQGFKNLAHAQAVLG